MSLTQKEILDRKLIAADFIANYQREVEDLIERLAAAHAHLKSSRAAHAIWEAKLEAGEDAPLTDLVTPRSAP